MDPHRVNDNKTIYLKLIIPSVKKTPVNLVIEFLFVPPKLSCADGPPRPLCRSLDEVIRCPFMSGLFVRCGLDVRH